MFERFTENARRVIFFARYEASQYGSTVIASEHLLLGLIRVDRELLNRLFGPQAARTDLRAAMEKEIPRGEQISTAVEVPLSAESKQALNLAIEEAQRLASRHVETQHLLLGLLGVKGSLAQRTLEACGLKLEHLRQRLAVEAPRGPEPRLVTVPPGAGALATVKTWLDGLNSATPEDLVDSFAEDAVFVDAQGKRWERDAFSTSLGALFATYAKKNVDSVIENPMLGAADWFVVTILWKNALLASAGRKWMHRMGMVWVRQDGWKIRFVQVTAVSG